MPWPQATQYNEAIQNLRSSVSDEELRRGQPQTSGFGVPLPYSGNFADVYKVHCPATGNTWAVKCFTREVPGLRDRYREISAQLQQTRLPFMVDFRYVEPGIRIGNGWYPFLKMRWVEGFNLNQFVGDSLGKPKTLRMLQQLWVKLAVKLRDAGVAHGDLQHGNILLVPKGENGQLALKLIDYDGMFVPKLSGRSSSEVGHPAYQHPQRLKEGTYNAHVDRFSQLAICCAIQGLIAGQKTIWDKFDNGDNLLFRETDFQTPETSEVLQELWKLKDVETHALVGRLVLATQTALDRVPWLDQIVPNGHPLPLSRDEGRQVEALMDSGKQNLRTVRRTRAEDIVLSWLTEGQRTAVPTAARTPFPSKAKLGKPPPASSAAGATAHASWWVAPRSPPPGRHPTSASPFLPGPPKPAPQTTSPPGPSGFDLVHLQLTDELRRAVPETLVREQQILPVIVDRDGITIVAKDPSDLAFQQMLEFALGRRVRLTAASPWAIAAAIQRLYGPDRHCPRCGRRLLSQESGCPNCLSPVVSSPAVGSRSTQSEESSEADSGRRDLLTQLNDLFEQIGEAIDPELKVILFIIAGFLFFVFLLVLAFGR